MIELLRKRRSIRSYTDEPVAQEALNTLVEALLRAPTSRNNTPWEFVVVDDRELLQKLSSAKEHGSSFLKGSPLGIVICADGGKSDVWVEDCSIAAILVQMTAESLGLGSCWIQIRLRSHDADTTSESYIKGVLGLPEQLHVLAIVSIGHPRELRPPLPADQLQYAKVKHNGYAQTLTR